MSTGPCKTTAAITLAKGSLSISLYICGRIMGKIGELVGFNEFGSLYLEI